jgi:hypothetical protein
MGKPCHGGTRELRRIVALGLAAFTAIVLTIGTAAAATPCGGLPYVLMLQKAGGPISAYQQPSSLNIEMDAPSYPPSRVLRDLHWDTWSAASASGTGTLWLEGNSGLGPPPAPTVHCSGVIDLRWRHCSVTVTLQDPVYSSQTHLMFFAQLLISSRVSEGMAGGGKYDWEWQPHGWVQVQGV